MASTIASLFGPSPEQIEYDEQQARRVQQENRYTTNLAGLKGDLPGMATGYVAGMGIGEGLGQAAQGIFGMEPTKDPALARSKKTRELFSQFEDADFNDADVLSKMGRAFADGGLLQEGMSLQQAAADIRSSQPETFYTASGETLMADPSGRYTGLDPKATYQVSTKSKKAAPLIEGKNAPKDKRTGEISGAVVAVRKNIADVRALIKEEKEEALTFATTGKAGEFVRALPRWMKAGTKANQFGKSLDTIKANVGFGELQKMRDNSPTGGALGQVSQMELDLLNSS